jgi:hypothetical protein
MQYAWETNANVCAVLVRKHEGKVSLEDLGIDRRMILKYTGYG